MTALDVHYAIQHILYHGGRVQERVECRLYRASCREVGRGTECADADAARTTQRNRGMKCFAQSVTAIFHRCL